MRGGRTGDMLGDIDRGVNHLTEGGGRGVTDKRI